MEDVAAAWRAANPHVEVEIVYGSSGNFVGQISQGAPYDVFFSADAEYPRRLEQAGLAPAGDTRLYAIGQIVLWTRSDSSLDGNAGLNVLTDAAVEKVSIANPEHAPYGRAAVAALQSAGIYESVRPKLVLGENVSQAAQFIESGGAEAGIIALSLALSPPLRDAGHYSRIPIDLYPPLEQGALVLDSAADGGAARAFVDYVLGPDGRAVLDRHGFLPPP
jgi:molybdate transport system substrate-binding protein